MTEIIETSPVASLLFAITIVSSFLALQNPEMMRRWILNPYNFVYRQQYHTILTSGFIHADLPHLALNMFAFYFFAFSLEEDMVMLAGVTGHFIFLFIYLVSMVLADISSIIKYKNDPGYNSLGASGAIAAVLFSFILFEPSQTLRPVLFPVPIPAPVFIVLYMVYSINASRKNADNINHEAHLYGAFAGLVLTAIIFPGRLPYFIDEVKELLPF